MMDPASLVTASQYVNNLLLARGLLRDGVAIDFAAPGKRGHDATMASIINLVHDLVLRRDRESEHLTSISQSFQELRTAATQANQAISKLEAEKGELQRELSSARSQARQAGSDLKATEIKNKAYKEDVQRLRVSVGQIRAQCANDVRKRDTEITRLKKHIDVRRSRDTNMTSSGPGGITIIDPTTGKAQYPATALKDNSKPTKRSSSSLADDAQENLAALSVELSESNDALVYLIRTTIATLKTLQGHSVDPDDEEGAANGRQNASNGEPIIQIAYVPQTARLNDQMVDTLTSLRTLLTNPSFAPIEEVEIRDEELARLRAGWETMESRWKEAIGLMNGWRHRMIGGETGPISLDEIQRGLDMAEEGLSVAGSPAQRKRGHKRDSTGSVLSHATDDAEVSMASTGSEPRAVKQAHGDDTPRVKRVRIAGPETGALFPAPHILKPTCGNRRRSPSPRAVQFDHAKEVDVEATPTPAQRISVPAVASTEPGLMSPDIWIEPELSVGEKLQEARVEAERVRQDEPEAGVSQQPAVDAAKPVKRNPIAKKTKSKRRSTLTPAELDGLMRTRL